MSTEQVPFDSQAPWARNTNILRREYDLEINPGEFGGWQANITINYRGVAWTFVQGDDKGTFTPGYAIGDPSELRRAFDEAAFCYTFTDEDVPKWMKAAIEHAGFKYGEGSDE